MVCPIPQCEYWPEATATILDWRPTVRLLRLPNVGPLAVQILARVALS